MVTQATVETRRRWTGQRLLLVTLWLTLMTLAIKVWVGWSARSLGLLAEALFTLTASFSLLLSLLALSAFTTATSSKRDWGHTSLEAGLTLLLIGFLGSAYCGLIGIAIGQIGFLPATATQVMLPAIGQLLGGITILTASVGCLGWYQARIHDQAVLQFTFGQLLQDAGLMALTIAGLLGANQLQWLDLTVMSVVLLAVFLNVWRMINWQLPSMLRQVAIAPEALAKLTRQVEGILHCYGIHSRGMVGRSVYVELRLILHPECLAVAPAIV